MIDAASDVVALLGLVYAGLAWGAAWRVVTETARAAGEAVTTSQRLLIAAAPLAVLLLIARVAFGDRGAANPER